LAEGAVVPGHHQCVVAEVEVVVLLPVALACVLGPEEALGDEDVGRAQGLLDEGDQLRVGGDVVEGVAHIGELTPEGHGFVALGRGRVLLPRREVALEVLPRLLQLAWGEEVGHDHPPVLVPVGDVLVADAIGPRRHEPTRTIQSCMAALSQRLAPGGTISSTALRWSSSTVKSREERASRNCSVVRGPMMGEVTPGASRSQARAKRERVVPTSEARAASLSMAVWVSAQWGASRVKPSVARAPAGAWPPRKRSDSRPPASGLHGMMAMPYSRQAGTTSRSTSRSSRL